MCLRYSRDAARTPQLLPRGSVSRSEKLSTRRMASFTGGGVSKAKHKRSDSDIKTQKRPKPTMPARQDRPSSSAESENNHRQMTKITLSSISKLEVRHLKRKLIAELEQVRSLINRANDMLAETPVPDKKLKTANKGTVQNLKNCNVLLTKLMKHKFGWIFNTPVDAVKLGLHDYHTIVKKPMDLGTVKRKLSKSCYKSPLEFAEDVRLTFNNARLYNPVGHDVHTMAEFLLKMFEEKWTLIETQYVSLIKRQQQAPVLTNTRCVEPLPLRSPTPSPTPGIVEDMTLERSESMTNPVEAPALAVFPENREEEEACVKGDLTFEEKQRLSEDLQYLPFDKLEAVVQIIKKRNPELAQQDDEIELDIDSLDIQTLWVLYRFVTEYKESLSKKSVQESVRAND